MTKPYSLARRLQLMMAIAMLMSLGVIGFVLEAAFVDSLEKSAQERLNLKIYTLLASADVSADGIKIPDDIGISDLNRAESGTYAVVRDLLGNIFWKSRSANSVLYSIKTAPLPIPKRNESSFMRLEQGFDEPVFVVNFGVAWEVEGVPLDYVLTVMESVRPFEQSLLSFRQALWGWLIGVVIFLGIAQIFLLTWLLAPLKRVIADIYAIQDGRIEELPDDYPSELSPLSNTLNELLKSEKKQRERFRHNLADLAHSLKTPLAVLRGIASDPSETAVKETLPQQVTRLDQMVTYQLQRAVISGRKSTSKPVDVETVLTKLKQTLDKVYASKNLTVEIDIEPGEQFFGDQHDLYEVLGNLTENAYKYTNTWVRVICRSSSEEKIKRQFGFVVEDDGPGVPPERRAGILARGVRLDSQEKGQGIGLAVVADIIDGYSGDIVVEESERGGARFVVAL